ncbi:hypothetical protein J2W97_002045 [Paenibacillus jamilae]|uniref:hypothetical protein n=1 Tax=Paenibacillus TaxID=44249 RepID=UPI000D318A29|nr:MULTISPECIES: hypothetical protein [Paenibacillus]MDP9676050.1 hypothetical protein [Paenibacillus jamilae]KAF6618415.1 hypothetical protein HFE00_10065 [Paenibacillus sp. EKM101P]KAF6624761.1 hypothetical protein HFE03_04230 [Paenibacillus sp. EKM102P]KAF6635459.1 hypothetical protein HFE01_00805 [Paenibacillus sp. EKM10P]KAF6648831.1 hypothetical protein HFE02_10750 [Paenibacillus sp. EKM11P]
MAEALNYRMNLVIDPKNVIKANRELRAMERYFERIQGRVLKIGRTRMAPEIVLNDMASKGLDNLLNKINRVKSQIINASGNVNVKVNSGTAKADPVKSDNNLSTVLKANTTAVEANTKAIADLSTKLGSVTPAAEKKEEPKDALTQVKDFLGNVKKVGEGVKSISEVPEAFKKFKTDFGILKGPLQGANRREKFKDFASKAFNVGKSGGEFLEKVGGGSDLIEGGQGLFEQAKGWGMINPSEAAGAVPSAASSSAAADAASSIIRPSSVAGAAEEAGSGLFKNLLKGGAKKLLGPLSYGMDIVNIAKATSGKERAEAIGSTVGGTAGSALGGAIGSFLLPGIGTVVGSTLGGMAGDFVGGKIGGLVSDYGPAMMEKAKSAGKFLGEKASQVKGWISDKAGDFGKSFSDFFSFGKKDEPKKEPTKPPEVHKPSIPPNSNIGASLKPLATMPPLYSASAFVPPQPGAKGVPNPYGPMAIANQGVNPSPMLNTAAHANNGAKAKGKANGNPTPQVVQISPEQMGTLSGFLKDFKTETTNQFNLPAGAVQVTVHENKLDVDGLITQIGYRLKAEILRATQNTKPTGAGTM